MDTRTRYRELPLLLAVSALPASGATGLGLGDRLAVAGARAAFRPTT